MRRGCGARAGSVGAEMASKHLTTSHTAHTVVDHRDRDGLFTMVPGGKAKDAGQNRRGSE